MKNKPGSLKKIKILQWQEKLIYEKILEIFKKHMQTRYQCGQHIVNLRRNQRK